MSQNLFRQLAALLPDAPVYVGRVLEHHDDDTSTVELPIALTTVSVGGGLARGALIRPRGRTVPVGGWAFVRRGVIETRAPDPAPEAISVGAPVAPQTGVLDTFSRTGDLTSDGEIGADWSIAPWFLSGGGGVAGGAGNITQVAEVTLDGSSAAWSLGTVSGNRAYMSASGLVAPPDVATFAQLDFTIVTPVVDDYFAAVYLVDEFGFICGCAQVFSQGSALWAMALGNYGERDYEQVATLAAGSHVLRLEINAARTVLTLRFDGTSAITLTLTEASFNPVSFVVLGFEFGAGNGNSSRYDRIEANAL